LRFVLGLVNVGGLFNAKCPGRRVARWKSIARPPEVLPPARLCKKKWSWLMAFFASAPEEHDVYSPGPLNVPRSIGA